jgi:phosphatidylserine/phosphatidylglycerophosphate/cardiolipin synthase-like enzyme
MDDDTLLKPGRNCWRLEHASRAAFLIDGQAYFSAFRAALEQARESILIVGWDIDSKIRLVRDDVPHEHPVQLGEFLNALITERHGLEVHVLIWDFAMIYALERELLPLYKLRWQSHHHLHFHMDDEHPVGASHHQKIVVVDDAVAFVGGFDLTKRHWDTSEHRADDPRRRDPDGDPYPPFHDVQMIVDGKAAAALGELARERWRHATGKRIQPPAVDDRIDPWPAYLKPDLEEVEIAIARTEPSHAGNPEVREVERLYLDAIACARRTIYIENEYLTSVTIGQALAARLMDADGPEIVLILSYKSSGWLEHTTMDVLGARVLRKLRGANRHGR